MNLIGFPWIVVVPAVSDARNHPAGVPWERPAGKCSGIRPAGVPGTRPSASRPTSNDEADEPEDAE